MSELKLPLGQKQIQEFLPHRYPFLMVDQILSIQKGVGSLEDDAPKSKVGIEVVGVKNVTINEPFFQGHFPTFPIMPGVMIIETMAQVASFSMYPSMISKKRQSPSKFQCVLVGVEKTRFRVPVVPGDVLKIETRVKACRTQLWTFECVAYVDGKKVAQAELMANLSVVQEESK